MAPLLMLLAGVLVHYSPKALAALGLGTVAAWETVAYGTEASLLWCGAWWAAPRLWPGGGSTVRSLATGAATTACSAARVAAACMACEGAQRALGRLCFDMHRRPDVPADVTYMEAALGPWSGWISPLAAFLATAYVLRVLSVGARGGGG